MDNTNGCLKSIFKKFYSLTIDSKITFELTTNTNEYKRTIHNRTKGTFLEFIGKYKKKYMLRLIVYMHRFYILQYIV